MPLNENSDDQDLIIRLREGGIKTLAELHTLYYKTMLYHARMLLPSREDAEDVVNELFLSLLKKEEAMNITKNVKGYLLNAVKYRCITFNTKAKREEEVLKAYGLTLRDFVPAVNRMEEAENQGELMEAINSLPPQLKTAIILCYLKEMEKKEIALKMGVSPTTVTKYISEALKRLAKFYSLKMF
ncbi:RNA polymerase sigma factor [Chitinophaga filiformis]|uniref:Sigma-70 region 2 n=1 Tax=Chitinophaga filiformis TaxID=104663 RepID=A0A1G7HNC1_CHIFI|nr:sigma-70 family RNA polymerase sigma factor [Chitinophaga filiformis]SDF01499.1 Sigma-70 region 2 [Chitinophaga filiformis]